MGIMSSLRSVRQHHPGTLGNLETLRIDAGFSQATLADAAGMSRLTVLRAENGRMINSVSVAKLAAALEVEPGALYTRPAAM